MGALVELVRVITVEKELAQIQTDSLLRTLIIIGLLLTGILLSTAYGLFKRRRWARILTLILAGLFVWLFPLGTVLAVIFEISGSAQIRAFVTNNSDSANWKNQWSHTLEATSGRSSQLMVQDTNSEASVCLYGKLMLLVTGIYASNYKHFKICASFFRVCASFFKLCASLRTLIILNKSALFAPGTSRRDLRRRRYSLRPTRRRPPGQCLR